MQARSLREPDEISYIDGNQDAILFESALSTARRFRPAGASSSPLDVRTSSTDRGIGSGIKRGELNILRAQIWIILDNALGRLAIQAHASDMTDGKTSSPENRLAAQDLFVADDPGEALFVKIRPCRFIDRHRGIPFR